MKLVVFGATGPSGQHLVKQALEQGHQVKAIVRSVEKLPEDVRSNQNFSHANASIFNSDELSDCIQGCDAVVSCLGVHERRPFVKITLYSESGKAIATAMQKQGIKRLVAVTSWCTVYDRSNPKIMEWFIRPFLIGRHLADMALMEEYVERETDLDFTFVRPPGLNNASIVTDRDVTAVEGQWVKDVGHEMPRENVVQFMLKCVADNLWIKKCVAIGLPGRQ